MRATQRAYSVNTFDRLHTYAHTLLIAFIVAVIAARLPFIIAHNRTRCVRTTPKHFIHQFYYRVRMCVIVCA